HSWPSFLPDSRHFLFRVNAANEQNSGIYAGSLDSYEIQRIIDADANALYTPPGYLLFTRGDTLLAQPFDASQLHVFGDAVPIGEGVSIAWVLQFAAFSVSNNGTLTFRRDAGTTQLTWFDRDGKQLDSVGSPAKYEQPVLSPDGKMVAVTRRDTQADIW